MKAKTVAGLVLFLVFLFVCLGVYINWRADVDVDLIRAGEGSVNSVGSWATVQAEQTRAAFELLARGQ